MDEFSEESHSQPMEMSEAETLALAIQGDRTAFGVLYERYVEQIYNYVYYRTGNRNDAEDLTARVFVRAMHHIHKYKDRGLPISAWFYRIAHNLVVNWHRDNQRRQEISLDEVDLTPHASEYPEAMLVESEEQALLLKAIRGLPPERQQLLILKFVERLSNAEVGQIMGRSEGAVKSLYHRTLFGLRERIGALLNEKAAAPRPDDEKDTPASALHTGG